MSFVDRYLQPNSLFIRLNGFIEGIGGFSIHEKNKLGQHQVNHVNRTNIRKWALFLPTIGASIFFILTIISMLVYPGGSSFYPDATNYSFIHNFFSDLGRSTTISGKSNVLSLILFTTGIVCIGISLIPHLLVFPSFFDPKSLSHILAILGSITGIISAIAYIGIGFTPWDLYLPAHMWFVYTAFTLTLPMVLCYVIALLFQNDIPKKFTQLYASLGIILTLYLILLFFGPTTSSLQGRIIQVIGQKIIVYWEGATFVFLGIFGTQLANHNDSINV